MNLTFSKYTWLALCLTFFVGHAFARQTPTKPNIILIVADDLGYGDLGVFYQNLRKQNADAAEPWLQTPNLDQLAASGAMLTNSYCAAPVCAPSRASMLTGVSQGQANVRDNQFDKALEDNYTIANVLKAGGYRTAVIGKWGLQGLSKDWPAHPLNRGFDYFFGYMRHSDGHEHYPKEGLYRKPKQVWENRTEISKDLDKCYTGDLFTAAAKKWIIEQQKRPFFMFLAFDNPHAVLELPTQAYPAKGGLNGGMQWLGKPGSMINTANGEIDSYVHPDYAQATYDHDHNPSTPPIPWPETYKRYATIVRRIDDQVGDLIQLLKDLKIYENTMVVFTSDNGPSIESYLPKPFAPNHPTFFNSFGPFDGIKRDVWEGGMRTPTLVAWPKVIKPKQVIAQPNISYDLLPTFAQAAGLTVPVRVDGVSLLPILAGKGHVQPSLIYTEYFEKGNTPDFSEFDQQHRNRKRNQMQLLRLGDTLAVRYDIRTAQDPFEIYLINKDPQQVNNLNKLPEYKAFQMQVQAKVLQLRMADTAAKRPYDEELIPSVKLKQVEKGLAWKTYQSYSTWIPQIDESTPIVSDRVAANGELMVYRGYFLAEKDGAYTFELTTNGKAFMKVHSINLIDADFNYQPNNPKQNTLHLKAGYHPVQIFAQSVKGTAAPTLQLKVNGQKSNLADLFYQEK
ncbi:MAG: sulfatase-like hydrolase/transferase [Pedobacter sp.]|nr:sulfatase-like hydrolase/transferase [Pedobacter sp.]MDQ8051426.1 sulfatase-like hydrolase/transferase [Pedobacter sp.]